MATELAWMSAVELARLIRRGKLSPVELLDATLDRISHLNPAINAFCTIAADQAREAARDAEQAARVGDDLGLLHGVPCSIKDLTATRGIRTTMGSRIFENHVPERDALSVERLRAAGAIIVGKTNTSEFGCKPFTDNQIFGATRNPWALERSPGGSSGGAAAAVAAGLGPIAEGTDLAGSIRQPAAWCGVVGFKPSQGRVPNATQPSGWSGFSSSGPITRTVADAALMFAAISGPDPRDPLSATGATDGDWDTLMEDWDKEVEETDLRELRIAWTPDLGGVAPMDPTVARVTAHAARAFEEHGCHVDEASPEIGEIAEPFLRLNAGVRYAMLGMYLPEWRSQMDPILVQRLDLARTATAINVARSEVERTAYHRRLCDFFEKYDLLLLPTTATAALPLSVSFPLDVGGRQLRAPLDMLPPTYAFNFSGHPAISVPAGFTPDGLPVGLQIVGGWQRDSLVLRAAAVFEQLRPWADQHPTLTMA